MRPLLFISLILLPQVLYSQRTLTDRQWIEDLDFMVHRIDSIHPGTCTDDSRGQMLAMAGELKEKIPVLSDNEILVELLRIVTVFHDGHTRLHGKNLTWKWYPVRLEKFTDGYFVTAAAKEYSAYIGTRVLSVNDLPVDPVFEKLTAISAGDNAYGREYFAPMYLTMSSVLAGLHNTRSEDEALILALQADGKRPEKVSVGPVEFETGDDLGWFWKDYAVPSEEYVSIIQPGSGLPCYLQNYYQPYWFTFIGEKAAYFAFNACENGETEAFDVFNARLWSAIDSMKAEYLIIDLRNNFGGTNSILEPMLHGIIKHDRINRKGHLFVITGKKTFSAAVHCATWIEFHCSPIFVGEPTGAGPNHYADPDFSVLPNSKLLLLVSRYYWQNSWPWDSRSFIEPEIKVGITSVEYFGLKDPVIERIFEYIEHY